VWFQPERWDGQQPINTEAATELRGRGFLNVSLRQLKNVGCRWMPGKLWQLQRGKHGKTWENHDQP
jgi:hypothetical protein